MFNNIGTTKIPIRANHLDVEINTNMLEKSISEQLSQDWIIVQLQDCFRQTRGQKSLPLDKSHYHCTVVSRALINSQLIGTEKN